MNISECVKVKDDYIEIEQNRALYRIRFSPNTRFDFTLVKISKHLEEGRTLMVTRNGSDRIVFK